MKTFGHAVKNAPIKIGEEVSVLQHTCVTAPCVITQIHTPAIASTQADWTDSYYTFYIDGRDTIVMKFAELAMEGQQGARDNTDGSPWGSEYFGKGSRQGGVYSTMRIPFQTRINVTFHGPPAMTHDGIFWSIVRGVEAYRITIGDVVLPKDARLRVQRFGPSAVHNLDIIPLANFANGTSGVLASTMFTAVSTDYTYLEACMRLESPTGKVTFLSSGGEDYFLSAFYFDEGMFHNSQAGLTFFDKKGSLSAYKVHDRDVIFTEGGGALKFRVGENTGGCGAMDMCPSKFCTEKQKMEELENGVHTVSGPKVSANVTYGTLAVFYEWDSAVEEVVEEVEEGDVRVAQLFAAVSNGHLSVEAATSAYKAACGEEGRGCGGVATLLHHCGARCFGESSKVATFAAAALKMIL